MRRLHTRAFTPAMGTVRAAAVALSGLVLGEGPVHAEPAHPTFSAPERHRTDPFKHAIRQVIERTGTRYFGASRNHGSKRHAGVDLVVRIGTPVLLPAPTVVLIGVCKKDSHAGQSIGNGVVFFVPDPEKPYFMLFAHLSGATLGLLNERHIGREIRAEPGKPLPIVAISGNTQAGKTPHLHVTTNRAFQFDGEVHTAEEFLRMYNEGTLSDFLNGRNFLAIVAPDRYRRATSLRDYYSPVKLMADGRLSITSRELSGEERQGLAKQITAEIEQLMRQRRRPLPSVSPVEGLETFGEFTAALEARRAFEEEYGFGDGELFIDMPLEALPSIGTAPGLEIFGDFSRKDAKKD
ncbi:MAG TPA: M23 family metallopeptidase [Candidatus Bilamarchaeaceae archaeon]|nr:M23 family metallopeptidase [Candidatus Bilamarchaeaceae archaeon]